ncbi:hypothetical protein M9Y10_041311 [Tritrichomonas musculus]|uniref:Serine/threonine-protein phosphatase n=1 Tax=Tritrichomonas musculus TaxID=1915356 RepID=A0ABR2K3Z8_9EUKA
MSANSSLPSNITPIFQKAFQCYRTLSSIDVSEYERGAAQLVFPVLPIPMLSKLCSTAAQIFSEEPIILNLPLDDHDDNENQESNQKKASGIIIVGDLHGHILDLLRILKTFGYPPKSSYLFLGDIVDRGDFSTESAVLILLMKVLWPKNIYLIRGNHEFPDMWDKSGFFYELNTIYGSNSNNNRNADNKSMKAVDSFAKAFSFIPLAAVLYGKFLCVHGGIGPQFMNYKNLNEIERPLTCYDFEPVSSILWSDPSESVETFMPSTRGSGFMFGPKSLHDFLQSQNLSLLIRGHQCTDKGVEFNLNNQVVTVFSASFYCGRKQNMSGVLVINGVNDKGECQYKSATFPVLRYIQRCEASFLFSSSENSLVFSSRAVKLNLPPSPPLPPPTPPVSGQPTSPFSSSPEKLPPNPNPSASPNNSLKSKSKNQNVNPNFNNSAPVSKALPHLPNAKPISNTDLVAVSSAPSMKHAIGIPTPSPRPKDKIIPRYRNNSCTSKDYQQYNNLNSRSKLLAADSNDLFTNETLSNLNPNIAYNSPLISQASSASTPIQKNDLYEPSHIFTSSHEVPACEPRKKGKSSQQMTQKAQMQQKQQLGLKINPGLKKANLSNSSTNLFEQTSAKNPSAMVVNTRKRNVDRGVPRNIYRKSVPV